MSKIVERGSYFCNGEWHQVAVTDKGRIVLIDCNYRRAKAFALLGGSSLPCFDLLNRKRPLHDRVQAWKKILPKYAGEILRKQHDRFSAPVEVFSSFRQRIDAQIREKIQAISGLFRRISLVVLRSNRKLEISGGHLFVPRSWWREVYLAGHATLRKYGTGTRDVVLEISAWYPTGGPRHGTVLHPKSSVGWVLNKITFARGGLNR